MSGSLSCDNIVSAEQRDGRDYTPARNDDPERATTKTLTPTEIRQTTPRDTGTAKRGDCWTDVSRQTLQGSKRLKTNDDSEETKQERKPKRKVACLIGYCGTGFHGMQLNPPNKTIEGTLFEAFVKTGAVSSDNADDPKKVRLTWIHGPY